MKQLLTTLFILLACALSAQPINDNCSGLIDLGVAPACPTTFFSNVNATATDIGFGNNPSCFNGGTPQNDVWFAFTTNDTTVDYSITVTGMSDGVSLPLRNPQIALYRGECMFDGLAELLCVSAPNGENIIRLDAYGLTPNVTYYIRINDYSSTGTPNWGTFQLCVDQLSPIFTIDEDGSTACFGQLFDSGGPDGDYGNNENHIFSICPTEFHNCIIFTLDYYNVESAGFNPPDQIIFFDGPTNNPATQIASIGGNVFPSDEGGGAVCYMVQASSGCLTVQFISDNNVTMEGFAGQWECTTLPCTPAEPITVQGNITNDDILNSITSLQTLVSVTSVNCPSRAYGTFQAGDDSELGLQRGLLLTSGDLNWAVGPNTNGGGGNPNATNNAPGDPDLDYLSVTFGDGTLSRDACIIELDVTAFTNEITFEYIFASEEYPEFVNEFNDIFAFLISGPGIVGDPNIGNQLNIAVLPDGSNTLVEINNVNHLTNWQYYRNNENGRATQYDGLTSDLLGVKKSLTARAAVTPCNTYHLKIAIADRLDFVYDSGVFLSEIRGGTPRLAIQYNSGIDYLIENCTTIPDNVIVQLSNVLDEPASYTVNIGGTAILGVDYQLNIPNVITFQPGQTQLSFPIIPLNDNLTEGIETIVITLSNDFGCGEVTYTTLTIELHDELVIDILAGQDTALVCQNASAELSVTGAATYFWTPVNIMNDPLSANPVATPTTDTWVYVQGNVGICTAFDSIFLQLVNPQISITALDPIAICQGESVRLAVTDNVNNSNLTWAPTAGLDNAGSPTPVATPQETTTYIATVRVFSCSVSDSITIDVNPFEFPVLNPDTLICQNYSVQLAEMIDAEATLYSWTPTTGLSDPTVSGPIATPAVTTTYILIATSENGACSDTAQVTVTVVPANISIQQPDTLEICLGTAVPLTAVTSTGSATGLRWSPANGTLSDTLGLNVTATPLQSTTYFARFEVGACVVFDSIYIRVDSLPAEPLIIADPEKDPYCPGETVILRSTIYEPSSFPDIRFFWLPGPGFETPDTLWNMVITTQDTFTYQRVINNRGCVDTASIVINVFQPPSPRVEPSDTVICQGQSVQLLALDYEDYEISWTPETGLSCTDCPNPIATPGSTTVYMLMVDSQPCPVGASANIIVLPGPTVDMAPSQTICLGESVLLNRAFDAQTTYVWTSNVDPNFISNVPELVVTPLTTTTYTLTATRIGCVPIPFTVTITVVPPPSFDAGQNVTVCRGTNVTLTATAMPSDPAGSFNWSIVGSADIVGTSAALPVVTQSLGAVTRYVATYTYGPGCGPVRDTVTVTVVEVIPIVSLTADSTEIIIGNPVTLTVTTDPPSPMGATYSWKLPDGATQSGQAVFTHIPVPDFPGDETRQTVRYEVTVTSPDGCPSTAFIDITVFKPNIQFPNVFTPNGDNLNDIFRPVPGDVLGTLIIEDFKVYNRWGQVVYNGRNNNNEGWDGTHGGKPAPSDVYVYRVVYRYPGNATLEKSGDITLIR